MTDLNNVPIYYDGKIVGNASSSGDYFTIHWDEDFFENFKALVLVGLVRGLAVRPISETAIPLTPQGEVMPLTNDEILNRTGYHKATETTGPMHTHIRKLYLDLMVELNQFLPDGRAKSVCLTQLEDSEMWANKAVAELAPLADESLSGK